MFLMIPEENLHFFTAMERAGFSKYLTGHITECNPQSQDQ
jgi:hypothetical protein